MSANNSNDTLLLLVLKSREIWPLAPLALTVAQTARRNLRRYEGALLLSRSGEIKTIVKVVVNGFWGNSMVRRITSALTGTWSIHVVLEDVVFEFSEVKSLVTEFVRLDQKKVEPNLALNEALEIAELKIASAASLDEVFQYLNLPLPSDALDGL